jgi:hypothetical protein
MRAAKDIHRAFIIPRKGVSGKRSIDVPGLMEALEILNRRHAEPSQELDAIADEIRHKFESYDDKNPQSLRTQAWELQQKEREAAAKRAEKVKEIVRRLDVSERQAQRLLKNGTTNREKAAVVADIVGKPAKKFLRRPKKAGRNPNLVKMFMRVWVDGCAFEDFINDPPPMQGDKVALVDALADAYDKRAFPDHVKELEPISQFARAAGIDAGAAMDLWDMFKAWRIERIGRVALAEVEGDLDDFG